MAKPEILFNPNSLHERYNNIRGICGFIHPLCGLEIDRYNHGQRFFSGYVVCMWETLFSLEQLRIRGIIPEVTCFTQNGTLNPEATETDYLSLFKTESNPGILHGIKVGVIGGPEGEIFAALGAEAVSIDPKLGFLPPHKWPNLTEVPYPLDEKMASNYAGWFDLTFSRMVFDFGNKLAYEGVSSFDSCLNLVLQMTKLGGISIHNGSMLPQILKTMDDSRIRVLEASPWSEKKGRHGESFVWIALQKLS